MWEAPHRQGAARIEESIDAKAGGEEAGGAGDVAKVWGARDGHGDQ